MVMSDLLLEEKRMAQLGLFVDYGQRSAEEEYRAAQAYARGKLRLERISIGVKGVTLGSQLMTGRLEDKPFLAGRNLLLLLMAGWKACELKTNFIAAGFRDTISFPDTSEIFNRGFSNLSYMAFGRTLTVLVPLLHMSKAEVVRLGQELGTSLKPFPLCQHPRVFMRREVEAQPLVVPRTRMGVKSQWRPARPTEESALINSQLTPPVAVARSH
jgi:7-cyano-7-deazaguanine synthase in queuosine biosynthesis